MGRASNFVRVDVNAICLRLCAHFDLVTSEQILFVVNGGCQEVSEGGRGGQWTSHSYAKMAG